MQRLRGLQQGALSPEQAAQAKQRLIEGHLWLAVSLVKRFGVRLCMLSPLDLVQQGNLGLLRYGLNEVDGRCHAPSTTALQLGLDCSTVCNLERGALQKLRALEDLEAEQVCHTRTCRRPASPRSPQEQVQRLEAACAELVAQSIPICVRTLARTSHVDKKVIRVLRAGEANPDLP